MKMILLRCCPGKSDRSHAMSHIYADTFSTFPSNGLTGDNVHPNDNVGYPWMGDRWYAAIKTYLN